MNKDEKTTDAAPQEVIGIIAIQHGPCDYCLSYCDGELLIFEFDDTDKSE